MNKSRQTPSDRRGARDQNKTVPPMPRGKRGSSWAPDQDVYGGGTTVDRDLDLDEGRFTQRPPKPQP